jgi:hypothetical protein
MLSNTHSSLHLLFLHLARLEWRDGSADASKATTSDGKSSDGSGSGSDSDSDSKSGAQTGHTTKANSRARVNSNGSGGGGSNGNADNEATAAARQLKLIVDPDAPSGNNELPAALQRRLRAAELRRTEAVAIDVFDSGESDPDWHMGTEAYVKEQAEAAVADDVVFK